MNLIFHSRLIKWLNSDKRAKEHFSKITVIQIGYGAGLKESKGDTIFLYMNLSALQWSLGGWASIFKIHLNVDIADQTWYKDVNAIVVESEKKLTESVGRIPIFINWTWVKAEKDENGSQKFINGFSDGLRLGMLSENGLATCLLGRELTILVFSSSVTEIKVIFKPEVIEIIRGRGIARQGDAKMIICELEGSTLIITVDWRSFHKIGGWFPHVKPILQLPDEDYAVIEPEVPKITKVETSKLVKDVLSRIKKYDPNVGKTFAYTDSDSILKNYKICAKIGQGAFGAVHLCWHPKKGFVAIKESICQDLEQSNLYLGECIQVE